MGNDSFDASCFCCRVKSPLEKFPQGRGPNLDYWTFPLCRIQTQKSLEIKPSFVQFTEEFSLKMSEFIVLPLLDSLEIRLFLVVQSEPSAAKFSWKCFAIFHVNNQAKVSLFGRQKKGKGERANQGKKLTLCMHKKHRKKKFLYMSQKGSYLGFVSFKKWLGYWSDGERKWQITVRSLQQRPTYIFILIWSRSTTAA